MKFFVVLALAVATVGAASLDTDEKPSFSSERIVNGHDAQPGEAPYIVSLQLSGSHHCGGSIIYPHWVLTAAHCLIGVSSLEVIAGLQSQDNKTGVQIREVQSNSFIRPDKYHYGTNRYDIGLIYIPEAFNLTALSTDVVAPVGKVSLPSGNYPVTGRGKVYGWGLDNAGDYTNVLQTLDVDIIDIAQCKAAWPEVSIDMRPSNICSYTAGTADGACSNDSGGPLVRLTQSGVEQVGIVSWGAKKCSYTKRPSVYTKVSNFKKWIKRKIRTFVPV